MRVIEHITCCILNFLLVKKRVTWKTQRGQGLIPCQSQEETKIDFRRVSCIFSYPRKCSGVQLQSSLTKIPNTQKKFFMSFCFLNTALSKRREEKKRRSRWFLESCRCLWPAAKSTINYSYLIQKLPLP